VSLFRAVLDGRTFHLKLRTDGDACAEVRRLQREACCALPSLHTVSLCERLAYWPNWAMWPSEWASCALPGGVSGAATAALRFVGPHLPVDEFDAQQRLAEWQGRKYGMDRGCS
jgi:hypothetical protein